MSGVVLGDQRAQGEAAGATMGLGETVRMIGEGLAAVIAERRPQFAGR